MSAVKRFVPEFAFEEINSKYITDKPLFKHEKEVFFFIVDLFFRLPVYNKNIKLTADGLIRISCKYFKKFIPNNDYVNYIRWLLKHDIIICDKIKYTGRAYAYHIHPAVESKLIPVEIQKDKLVTRNIIKNFNRKQQEHKKQKEHVLVMKSHFKKNLKIELNKALTWIEKQLVDKKIDLNQYNVYYISVQMINDKDFYFKTNKTNGRLDSNLTNLKSELRQFLIGDYCHIDCRNSQPFLVNILLDFILNYKLEINECVPSKVYIPSLGNNISDLVCNQLDCSGLEVLKKFPLNSGSLLEFKDYKHATLKLDFYSYLKEKYELNSGKDISREEMKKIVYKVFFSQNKSYPEEKKVFKQLYPTIYKIFYRLKVEKHNKLAICLQRIESEIFIQMICKKMVENNIIPFTIHDSLIVLSKDKDLTLEIMNSVYLELMDETPKFEFSNL